MLEASEPGELIGLIPRVAPDEAANLAEANDLEPVEALGALGVRRGGHRFPCTRGC